MEKLEELRKQLEVLKGDVAIKQKEIDELIATITELEKSNKFQKGKFYKRIFKCLNRVYYTYIQATSSLVNESGEYGTKLYCKKIEYTFLNETLDSYCYYNSSHIIGPIDSLVKEWNEIDEEEFEDAKKKIIDFFYQQLEVRYGKI